MTPLLQLAARSAWNRRFSLGLVTLSIALSTLLLLGIERLRVDVRANFAQAVSGTDLIVGARTGPVQLLLYAVFRIGAPASGIELASAEAVARHRAVAWMVPLALGDSHRGFAVLGTTPAYFEHFRYGARQPLVLAQGRAFGDGGSPAGAALYEAVIGAELARRLGYGLGQKIVLAHGDGAMAHNDHGEHPFTVVGVLAPTGTPVDRTVHIGLRAMSAIHDDWASGTRLPAAAPAFGGLAGVAAPPAGVPGPAASAPAAQPPLPRSITAALLGLKSRAAVFAVQREVQAFRAEPLMAVLPGVALDELWDVVALGERGLQAMSALVAVVSLAGLVAVILAGLNERRRELAILRAVGAGPRQVLALLALEGGLVTAAGVALGAVGCALAVALLAPWVQAQHGISLHLAWPGSAEWALIGAVLAGGFVASLVPGWRAYRLSLADGLSPRI
ncbi:ABC transporter permease [Aquabacterium sp. OR-4]|uniref:ABC transporter permease n=1 Tax=Aquabacterium sp. OR-4 TaxID=2978127 RepID=UPI0021B20098|nr:ABC transporter permease [Aquabacterium sp. OR-4]MDT7833893.1 ABC transporter permease [Aquabacterium sp. OR-4]